MGKGCKPDLLFTIVDFCLDTNCFCSRFNNTCLVVLSRVSVQSQAPRSSLAWVSLVANVSHTNNCFSSTADPCTAGNSDYDAHLALDPGSIGWVLGVHPLSQRSILKPSAQEVGLSLSQVVNSITTRDISWHCWPRVIVRRQKR